MSSQRPTPTLLRLDSTIQGDRSTSRLLADRAEAAAIDAVGGRVDVLRRDLGRDPLPSAAWAASISALGAAEGERTAEQRAARDLAEGLTEELELADGILIAAPLYNWGVSQHLKTWVDLVLSANRVGPRGSTIAGKPAVLAVTRGGDYRPESGHPEWDFATGWMRRIFVDIWQLDLSLVEVQLTLAPHHDYMAHLRDDAATQLRLGESAARREGRRLGLALLDEPVSVAS